MRWLWPILVAVLTWPLWDMVRSGQPILAVVYGAVAAAIAWWINPWRGRNRLSQHEIAAVIDDPHRVVIYWRPGCMYCARLRLTLGRAGRRATWINIWQDPEAAAFVRSVNDGNETVPTVVLDGIPHTNPDPGRVRDRLNAPVS